ncbi:hypothetical protein [Pedobacter sp. MC2016-24]|uniref:hypothetical protein n=1 Tax=Pedobacter sp. MC2016-24 TaxID=2780090 RepID=UPI001880CDC4|nr:hypothetical protein [Pedobacter sp. MC2016-24]MBE9601476.1 hypothetical protein [Pedobacter sp. MC2016-24]
MNSTLTFNSLFIYSEKNKKYFYDDFGKGINLIYGPNTSGKSTLVQSLIYTFGINDGKEHLEELLSMDLFFRLDCTFKRENIDVAILLIREGGTLYVKIGDIPLKVFNGINGNNSFEHVKLKHFFHELFNFNLFLESKEEYKEAPIEAVFLPYYISQSVGWVYLRKSFSSLDFFRNFKDDYLDYYLGIETAVDREEKKKLEAEVLKAEKEQTFLTEIQNNHIPLQVSKMTDESFTTQSLQYLDDYKTLQDDVAQKEKEYLFKSNELSFLSERKSVVSRIKSSQIKQDPGQGSCPMCSQSLPYNMQHNYTHQQELNDTLSQYESIKTKITSVQSEVNSLKAKIEKIKKQISEKYEVFKSYSDQEITLERWIDNKANLRLNKNILSRLGQLTLDLSVLRKSLEVYKTDEEVAEERSKKNYLFKDLFEANLKQLKVKELSEDRYTTLYKISAFPFQGVELHKTIMAYHFAFNSLISKTKDIHRLPFILDAVFKEDLDEFNEDLLIEFISKNRPKDTQLFMTISEKTKKASQVARYQREFLNNEAKTIQIGNGRDTRTLLKAYNGEQDHLLKETMEIINLNSV